MVLLAGLYTRRKHRHLFTTARLDLPAFFPSAVRHRILPLRKMVVTSFLQVPFHYHLISNSLPAFYDLEAKKAYSRKLTADFEFVDNE